MNEPLGESVGEVLISQCLGGIEIPLREEVGLLLGRGYMTIKFS